MFDYMKSNKFFKISPTKKTVLNKNWSKRLKYAKFN